MSPLALLSELTLASGRPQLVGYIKLLGVQRAVRGGELAPRREQEGQGHGPTQKEAERFLSPNPHPEAREGHSPSLGGQRVWSTGRVHLLPVAPPPHPITSQSLCSWKLRNWAKCLCGLNRPPVFGSHHPRQSSMLLAESI